MSFETLLGGHPLVAALALCHGAALVVSAPGHLTERPRWIKLGFWLMVVAFVLNTGLIAGRWIEAGRPPFKTMFETMLFYPWCVGLVTLVLIGLHRLQVLVPFASAISLAGLGYALMRPDVEVVNLPPALQSAWFVPHVVTYFVAYAGLFLSFALALLALLSRRWKRAPQDSETRFQGFAHLAAAFGTAALTLGLVLGAIWGKFAWGDYWTWDPKENWALVTWLSYMIYLHLRLLDGWSGRRALWVLVAAFGTVAFTYLGVHLLPTANGSLHVYQ